MEKVKVAALRQAVLEAAMLQHAPETLKRARELQDQLTLSSPWTGSRCVPSAPR